MKALEELIEEGARNPAVRKALAGATRRLAADPEFKAIVEQARLSSLRFRALIDEKLAGIEE